MRCTEHFDREALGSCVVCGRGVCLDCLNKVQGRIHCAACQARSGVSLSLSLQHRFQELQIPQGRSATVVTDKNRYLAALLAFSLGWLGIHKYYMGQIGWGIAYTLFSWTFIPALAGTIEGILYLIRSDEDFVRRYGRPTLLEAHTTVRSSLMPRPGIDYERFLLQFARQHQGRISMAHLMADSQLDLDKAEEALARLSAKGLVESEISPQGQLYYIVPEFRQLGEGPL